MVIHALARPIPHIDVVNNAGISWISTPGYQYWFIVVCEQQTRPVPFLIPLTESRQCHMCHMVSFRPRVIELPTLN